MLAAATPALVLARPRCAAVATLAVCVAVVNEPVGAALGAGHPEEILCAALCVTAVVLALRGCNLAASVAFGLALATKQWALVAAGPFRWRFPGDADSRSSSRSASRCSSRPRSCSAIPSASSA